MPRKALWSGLLLLAAFVLYAVNLGRAPIYLHEAEVLFALQAHSIAMTAHDTSGRLLPVYFQMPAIGENVWFHPVAVYIMVPFLRLLPMTESVIRLPSVFVGLIDLVLMYLIAKRLFGSERWALVASILLALTPAHYIHSRMAMDYLYPVPFVMAWLLCLLIFIERGEVWILFVATSFLGMGFYSYIASVIMMPIYLLVTCLALSQTGPRPMRQYLVAVTGFAWPLAILVLWMSFHPTVIGQTLSRYQVGEVRLVPALRAGVPMAVLLEEVRHTVRFSELTGRVSMYWYFFDPAYLFLSGGYASVVNSTRHVGVFLAPLLIFVPVGLARVATARRAPITLLVLIGFLSAPLAACLVVPEPYAVARELGLLPFGVMAATFGVKYMIDERGKAWRIAGLCLLALVPLHFAFFCVEYFGNYRLQSAFWFEWNRRGALEEIIAREPKDRPAAIYMSTHRIPYLDEYWRLYLIKHGRQDLLLRTVYFEADTLDVRTVPPGSVLLASRQDASLAKLVETGELRTIALIPEPGDPPAYAILGR
jgi:4-amino-4-deoxy-L-arabinose transferase-like glycosyltransferase